ALHRRNRAPHLVPVRGEPAGGRQRGLIAVIARSPRQNCEAILRWSDDPSSLLRKLRRAGSPPKRLSAKAEAIQLWAKQAGLLRGACHRAALRADPLARNDG